MSRKVPNSIREQVLNRQKDKCKHCHETLIPMKTHFDHIHQHSKGGDNDSRNIDALCSGCHDLKSRTESRARANEKRIEKKKNLKNLQKKNSIGDVTKTMYPGYDGLDSLTPGSDKIKDLI